MEISTLFLRNIWYMATPGNQLRRGKMMAKQLLGKPLLIGRDANNGVFALRNICPHRGIPLTYGKFDGKEIECCYHGWHFNTQGVCTCIPALTKEQDINITHIKTGTYPCREHQGNIWIYMGECRDESSLPPVPTVPIGETFYKTYRHSLFACSIDHAVMGLMDPAHGPFVHQSWWWRNQRSMHEKHKQFEPAPLGFKMSSHKPSKNSTIYKILGGDVTTEIRFQLPGIRIEHIQAGKINICGLTTVTPIDESHTEVTQTFYWQKPWLNVLKPLLHLGMNTFLKQDRDAVEKQQEGLKYKPRLMLIPDADKQALWYQQLKKEYQNAQQENREFINPVQVTTLSWCS